MIRTRVSATLGIAIVLAGALWLLTMPSASADDLPNGLTMSCSQDSDVHATCIIGGWGLLHG